MKKFNYLMSVIAMKLITVAYWLGVLVIIFIAFFQLIWLCVGMLFRGLFCYFTGRKF